MSEKDFDLDKILSDSFSRLDKIAGKTSDEKKDLSEVTFGAPDSDREETKDIDTDNAASEASANVANDEAYEVNNIAADSASPEENAAEDSDDPVIPYGEAANDSEDNSGDDDSYGDEYDGEYDDTEPYDDEYDGEEPSDEDNDEEEDFVEDYQDVSGKRKLEFNMDRDDKPKKHKKKKVKPNNSIFVGTLIAVIVISISFILSFMAIQLGVEYIGLTRSDESITFDVPVGSGADTIANLLYQKGIIDNPTLFKFVMKISGKTDIVPGSITLSPNMTYPSIISELVRSRKVYETVTVTFSEGISLYRAAKILEENEVCSASDFLDAFNKSSGFDFEQGLELTPQALYKMEGFMFPDTYEFYIEDEPENVVSKLKGNFEAKMDADKMKLVEQSGLSLYEVITLASIVQAEANTVEDMKLVASVFLNRLTNRAEFPYLQSDATYFYVTNTIASALGNTSVSSYEYLYSTYSCYGLPVGPIGNPGMDAIMAVLEPAHTDYFYFVTDSITGEFYYASTFEEHEANVEKAGY